MQLRVASTLPHSAWCFSVSTRERPSTRKRSGGTEILQSGIFLVFSATQRNSFSTYFYFVVTVHQVTYLTGFCIFSSFLPQLRDDSLQTRPTGPCEAAGPATWNAALAPRPTTTLQKQPRRRLNTPHDETRCGAGRGSERPRERGRRAAPTPVPPPRQACTPAPVPPQPPGAQHSPSGRCPARSRRTPHSWRVRRGRKPGERRKRRIPGARSYMATPTTRWGVLWPARGPGGRGSQEGEVNTELECSKAGRHLRREERNGAGRGRRAGRGEAGGRRPGPPQLGQG